MELSVFLYYKVVKIKERDQQMDLIHVTAVVVVGRRESS